MTRAPFGAALVAAGTPTARRDVWMLGLPPAATLEKACWTLAVTGLYEPRALRVNALRALARHIERRFDRVDDACRWLARRDRRLGVWGACSCARESLRFVLSGELRPLRAIETAEAWVRGDATTEDARAAANAAAGAARAAPAGAHAAARAAYAGAHAAYAALPRARTRATHAAAAAAAAAATAPVTAYQAELHRLVGVVAEHLVLLPEAPF